MIIVIKNLGYVTVELVHLHICIYHIVVRFEEFKILSYVDKGFQVR